MSNPRHPNADPDCPDCHGYGYIHVDDERYIRQVIGPYIEYGYDPIYEECDCTIKSKKEYETTDSTASDYF